MEGWKGGGKEEGAGIACHLAFVNQVYGNIQLAGSKEMFSKGNEKVVQ